MAHMKPEILFSRCARILLMLDEGRYNRSQMAEKLGVSVPTVARYLSLFRDRFEMKIAFRVDPAGQYGVVRLRGRSGALFISEWGVIKRERAIRLCKAFLRATADKSDPDNADLFKFLCCNTDRK